MGEKSKPATLEERQEILKRCLQFTQHKARRLALLMAPEMDADDIQSEVGVRVWKAMVKRSYLKKSSEELLKIGFVTARRHISQLIRNRLTVKKYGAAGNTYVPFHNKHVATSVSLLMGKDYSHISVTTKVFLFEMIRNEAISLVGLGRYPYLLKALQHDWLTENLTEEQCLILTKTDYSQERLMRALSLLAGRVSKKAFTYTKDGKKFASGDSESETSKVNGVWLQNTEVPAKILA